MMKKHIIWVVVALMASAFIGIIFLQTKWIRYNILLNEEKFDKEVFSALNHVEKRVSKSISTIDFLNSSFKSKLSTNSASRLDFYLNQAKIQDSVIQVELIRKMIAAKNKGENMSLLQGVDALADVDPMTLLDFINLREMNNYLHQELEKRGIVNMFNYGVFSKRNNDFIILNGNYVIPQTSEQYSVSGVDERLGRSLRETPYKIDLFTSAVDHSNQIPGSLFISFPNRKRIFFQDLIPTIVASILFTSIILGCFVYTVSVIFRQKKLSEMKTDFINNMTHEFKTPIATINLAVDSIKSPMIMGNPDKINRFAKIIKQENSRLLNQVEKVLQMALLDRKKYNLRLTDVNIHEIIYQAVEHSGLQVEHKGGRLITSLEASQSIIHADQTHISNIIHNLLDNANKYSPQEPIIEVHTQNANGNIEVSVRDNGIGMTKEQLKHIFDKFYRVHTGNVHDIKGFGLGLSYVKAMVEAHGGSISVKSELDNGSTFTIRFPVKVRQEKKENSVMV